MEKKRFSLINFIKSNNGGDLVIVLLVLILCIFGIIMVFSASYYTSINESGSPYAYLRRQLMWFAIGLAAMIVLSRIDYHFWLRFSFLFYVAGILLLLALFIPGVGIEINGATRWIGVGPITIMPGEIAKITLIFYLSGILAKSPGLLREIPGLIAVVAAAGIYAALILKQPNMSTAATVIFIAGGMMLVAGAKIWQLIILAGLGFAGGVALIFSSEYRHDRFLSFLDPFEDSLGNGFQAVQSLLALGTGGFTGLGLGNSVQKYLYLPEPQNDFITAIIGEELGFVGIIILMAVYLLLIWRGCKAAMNAKDYYGMMMAAGITIMIGVQVAINIAVVTSSMPPTGVILPFISYGGNALMLLMGLMGILWNITKQSEQNEIRLIAEREQKALAEEREQLIKRTVRQRNI
ncbi:MAG: putative lipid II flippase FtsW [Firmicutes bacterium]|nr:putative lipid II flippase FtsW [Bacillota bacterium]